MPPSVVNIGAWIGANISIDSHVTIGTCSQIGAGVKISSRTQIGGVIQPLDAFPAIVGDNAVIGGNCGIYDGVHIGRGARPLTKGAGAESGLLIQTPVIVGRADEVDAGEDLLESIME